MPAPVKAGTAERYWREVDGLQRLEVALLRDEALEPSDRDSTIHLVQSLKGRLVDIAQGRGEPVQEGPAAE